RLPRAHGREDLPRRRPGAPRADVRHGRRTDRPSPHRRPPVRRRRLREALGDALRGPRDGAGRLAARDPPGDRAHAPDPRAHVGPAPPVRGGPHLRGGPDARAAAGPDPAVAARRPARVRAPRDGPAVRGLQQLSGGPGAGLAAVAGAVTLAFPGSRKAVDTPLTG